MSALIWEKVMLRHVIRDARLNPAEKLVYLCLLDHAGESRTCWPSWRTIRAEVGVSNDTIGSALVKLERLKYIHRPEGPVHRTRPYTLLLRELQPEWTSEALRSPEHGAPTTGAPEAVGAPLIGARRSDYRSTGAPLSGIERSAERNRALRSPEHEDLQEDLQEDLGAGRRREAPPAPNAPRVDRIRIHAGQVVNSWALTRFVYGAGVAEDVAAQLLTDHPLADAEVAAVVEVIKGGADPETAVRDAVAARNPAAKRRFHVERDSKPRAPSLRTRAARSRSGRRKSLGA